jgi:3-dehydroquinate dehydratase-2
VTSAPDPHPTSADADAGANAAAPIVLVLHGPNLNLLGQREPHLYGTASLADHVELVRSTLLVHGIATESFQSNHEGELIDAVHGARGRCAAIIVNPGAFTHYSWALHDALATFTGLKIEVHISNPNAREPWRHTSVVAPVVTGSIIGLGIDGYRLAAEAVARRLSAA